MRNERTAVVNGVRSYSASAYYCPASRRKNLHVLTGAQVRVSVLVAEFRLNSGHQATKILFASSTAHDSNPKATGVTFVSGAVSFTANASKEIILAAGAVQTPQLLELSGMRCVPTQFYPLNELQLLQVLETRQFCQVSELIQ